MPCPLPPPPGWEENLYTKGWRKTLKSGDVWVTQVVIWDSSFPEEKESPSWVILRKGESPTQQDLPEVWETQELDPGFLLDPEKIPC